MSQSSFYQPLTTIHHSRFVALLIFLLSACSSVPTGQPQVQYHLALNQYDEAVRVLKSQVNLYGARNRLLYDLDLGLTLHYAGRYQESIKAFERAKVEYEKRNTTSVSRAAASWVLNDTVAPYRGEDYERVMINIFQAVNFAVLGDFEGALVEARNVDRRLALINERYPEEKKNVYKEDAFARLLMGIMYEASGSREDINDAWIEYARAYEIYKTDYARNYNLPIPSILRENYLAAAEFMHDENLGALKRELGGPYPSLTEKQRKAEVYLIHDHGTSPTKYQAMLPIPIDGILTPVAFPVYQEQFYPPASGSLKAVSPAGHFESSTELAENIGPIAQLNLDNRRLRTIVKSAIRSGVRTAIEQNQIENIEDKHDRTAQWVTAAASVYNMVAEQADLRSWQTLPGEIRLGRLILEPGEYDVFFRDQKLGHVNLKAADKKFFVVRTVFQ